MFSYELNVHMSYICDELNIIGYDAVLTVPWNGGRY